MTALDYFAAMLTDPWLMGGISIGASVLVLAVWLLRDETRRQAPDRHATARCVPRHIVVMGVDGSGRAWYAPHCAACDSDGPLFSARYTDEAWDALRDWRHACGRVSA